MSALVTTGLEGKVRITFSKWVIYIQAKRLFLTTRVTSQVCHWPQLYLRVRLGASNSKKELKRTWNYLSPCPFYCLCLFLLPQLTTIFLFSVHFPSYIHDLKWLRHASWKTWNFIKSGCNGHMLWLIRLVTWTYHWTFTVWTVCIYFWILQQWTVFTCNYENIMKTEVTKKEN